LNPVNDTIEIALRNEAGRPFDATKEFNIKNT
jgi:hypothetical protein